MSWTIENACTVIRRIEPICSRYGLLVGIYGSVARGENGNDLDLMLCPKCCHYDITACVNAIAREFSGLLSECYHGLMKTNAYTCEIPGVGVLDIRAQNVSVTDEDLYAWKG